MFHVSNEDSIYHYPHCPKLINLGQAFQKTLFIKYGLYIFLGLNKDTDLEKCLHGKTQIVNESFNGTISERISKNTFVTLPNLEFGIHDSVAHCNIRMKALVLIYEKLNFIPVVYMLKGFKKRNLKRVNLVNQRASRKNKLRRQILQGKKMSKNDKVLEKEDHMYIPGKM